MDRRLFFKSMGITAGAAMLPTGLAANPFIQKKYPNIKPIMGSWFEFRHNNRAEGKYWNPALQNFTAGQWREKIKEISEAGLQYLVLMGVAGDGEVFYKSKFQKPSEYACHDPLEEVLSAADEYGIKFFVGNDFYQEWWMPHKLMTDPAVFKEREEAMAELVEKYGHHKSFYGWYFANETGIIDTIDETTIDYVNRSTAAARRLMPKCVNLIAPYGTKSIRTDDLYVKKLEQLDIDIIAYQDEIGVRKTPAGKAGFYFEKLYYAHAKAGRARLWADMEIFEFEDSVMKSPLIPANFERVFTQMNDISPFVEHILIYQYQGMMNKPGSSAFAGHPDSTKLYSDYMNWYNNRK